MTRPIYLIQGLAQSTDAWDQVVHHLPAATEVTRVDMPSLGFADDNFSLERAAVELEERISHPEAVICGLSSGAVVAAQHAIMHPGSSYRYVLAGGQVKPRKWLGPLMRLGHPVVHRFMELRSRRRLDPRKVRSITDTYARLDLRDRLTEITAPVLVLVGTLDRVHYKPAGDILQRVARSQVAELRRAGQESNKSAPAQFAQHLARQADCPSP